MRRWPALLVLGGVALAALPARAELAVRDRLSTDAMVIDSRPLADCARSSVAVGGGGSVLCLPPDMLYGPHGRLVDAKVLLWRLGTLGLRGDEAVQVVGDDPVIRDALAGLLHLAGQARVMVVDRPWQSLPGGPGGVAPGMIREVVYIAPMRDDLVVLRHELAAQLRDGSAPVLADARPEPAYWGARIEGARGGHLPGAQSFPLDRLRASRGAAAPDLLPPAGPVIAYGHGAAEGLALFTELTVQGAAARVYPGGWSEWAASALPVDAETHPDPEAGPGAGPKKEM